MNRRLKVITINGIRGLIALIFVALGLIAGFIISPGWACMKLWNHIFAESNIIATMNLFQGIILWAIIALTLYALNNKKSLIGFRSFQGLSPEQIKDIIKRSKETDLSKFTKFETTKFNVADIKDKDLTMQPQSVEEESEKEEIRS